MSVLKNPGLLGYARNLRREMTPQERKLWYLFLRKYPVKFYKQRIVGPFIVDFYCASARLVIEIDGSQHYDTPGMEYDSERTEYLQQQGLKVLRFSNADINSRFTNVCDSIHQELQNRTV